MMDNLEKAGLMLSCAGMSAAGTLSSVWRAFDNAKEFYAISNFPKEIPSKVKLPGEMRVFSSIFKKLPNTAIERDFEYLSSLRWRGLKDVFFGAVGLILTATTLTFAVKRAISWFKGEN